MPGARRSRDSSASSYRGAFINNVPEMFGILDPLLNLLLGLIYSTNLTHPSLGELLTVKFILLLRTSLEHGFFLNEIA